MARRHDVLRLAKSFKRRYDKIRKVLESSDPVEAEKLWREHRRRIRETYKDYTAMMVDFRDTYNQYKLLVQEVEDLEKTRDKYYNNIKRLQEAKDSQRQNAYFDPDSCKKVAMELRRKQEHLVVK